MYGTKKNAALLLTLIILCTFLVFNVVYIGIALLARGNAPVISGDLSAAMTDQNQHLIINDMPTMAMESADMGGLVEITQGQLQATVAMIFSSYFIYFIFATNVQDFNLFPSRAKLNQSTRQKIYDLIERNEGIHLREICRALDKKMGVVQYHIYVLEGANLISSMKDGRYKRFFVNHRDSPGERLVISILQRETTGKVLMMIFEKNGDGVSHSSIAKEMKSSSQAITWHIHKLTDAGIISTTKMGNQKVYQITPEFYSIVESLL
ncbi:MAG: hypothetical protein HWN65_17470 [Candidatus Helarchaeota archaeon]|nr:hypothetical protein [Candidatus Helarchaeota archaeon]